MRHQSFLKNLPRRERSGRPQRERIEDIIAVAVEQRRKNGVEAQHVRSQLAGDRLGRLRLQAEITAGQFAAGERFGAVVRRYARVLGLPSANPRSASLVLPGGGQPAPSRAFAVGGGEETLDPQAIAAARRAYDDMITALLDATGGRAALAALKALIIADQPAPLGDLRCGLNVLCRLWR